MIGIGIRVYSNSKIYYSIINETDDEYVYLTISHLNIPLALNEPERLNYVRNTLLDIIDEYNIDSAVIRVQELMYGVNESTVQRFYVEGVILETLAGGDISSYKMGKIATLTSLLKIEPGAFKEYADNVKKFELLPEDLDWKGYCLEERESILACHASLNLK